MIYSPLFSYAWYKRSPKGSYDKQKRDEGNFQSSLLSVLISSSLFDLATLSFRSATGRWLLACSWCSSHAMTSSCTADLNKVWYRRALATAGLCDYGYWVQYSTATTTTTATATATAIDGKTNVILKKILQPCIAIFKYCISVNNTKKSLTIGCTYIFKDTAFECSGINIANQYLRNIPFTNSQYHSMTT